MIFRPQAMRKAGHGHADLGIAAGVPATALAGLQARTLLREEFVAIVRRDHALAARASVPLAALAAEPMVLVPPATYTGSVIHAACRKAGFAPRAVLALESGEALRETVRAGLGLTILPAGYLGAHERDLRAVRLTAPTPGPRRGRPDPGRPHAAARGDGVHRRTRQHRWRTVIAAEAQSSGEGRRGQPIRMGGQKRSGAQVAMRPLGALFSAALSGTLRLCGKTRRCQCERACYLSVFPPSSFAAGASRRLLASSPGAGAGGAAAGAPGVASTWAWASGSSASAALIRKWLGWAW